MHNYDPLTLKRTKRETRELVLRDPLNPQIDGKIIKIITPKIQQALATQILAEQRYSMYTTPDKETGECIPLFPIDGEPIEITEELVNLVTSLEIIQVTEPGYQKWTFEELYCLADARPEVIFDHLNTACEMIAEALKGKNPM